MRRLALIGAVVLLAACAVAPAAQADPADFRLETAEASLSTAEAGAHPDFTTNFEVATDPNSTPNAFGLHDAYGATKDVTIDLPAGLMGSLNAVPPCSVAQLASWNLPEGGCPNASQVGTTVVYAYGLAQAFTEPVYLMEPPGDGRSVARLGFIAGLYTTLVEASVRSESDYGITARVENASSTQRLVKAETKLWGVPGAAVHDTERQTPKEAFNGATASPPRDPGIPPVPFLTNPTSCGAPLSVRISVDSWTLPDEISSLDAPLPPINGCDKVLFSPTLNVEPTERAAGQPSGLDTTLSLPQDESPSGRATAALRDAVVTLPEGLKLNSSAADGLVGCDAQQVGYQQPGPSHCPDAARIGTAEFDVPALTRPVHGFIYQRAPEAGHLFRIWLVSDELGVHVKIPGEIEADHETGQLTSVFLDTPQVPLRTLKLHFKDGSRAPLTTPACGTYETQFEFRPWTGRAPVSGVTPMTIDRNCAAPGFAPGLAAGATIPLAGRFSPFVTTVTLGEGEQDLSSVETKLPAGVLAKLSGVEVCPDSGAASGACPAGSRIGSVTVATGAGSTPLWIPQPGKAPTALYLAGPYDGAPYSIVFVVPAQAGPFDLGTVVTRAAIRIDPESAEVTVKSDPLPQILEGVPVVYRTISVSIDRPGFTRNPTGCGEEATAGTFTSMQGATATASSRFAVGGCRGLDFEPKLSLSFKGAMRRAKFPALKSVLTFPRGGDQADISRAEVLLPSSEQIENSHIGTPCTRVEFAAQACPASSVLGTARAITPLLDQPLSGAVYFRTNGGARPLPDIVADLRGQIHVVLVGYVDSVHRKGGKVQIRTTFGAVPDAPVSKFVIELAGGRKGWLVNSANLCRHRQRATARFTGHNGAVHNLSPRVRTSCSK